MNLLASEKADSEVTGHVILLFITILGVSVILLYGVPTILNLENMVIAKNAEQTFAVQDSRASRAVLGDSPLQITDINLGGGSPTVEPNSTKNPSYMIVKSQNNTFNVTLPMGKVVYQLGNRIVAYEDGGVWSKYPTGGSIMLSPPEFHYNGVTLTLPVFNISGNASVGGMGTAAVSFNRNAPIVRYPNTSCAGCNANMTNPVNFTSTGKVYVNITSDYYDAWADFANQTINYAKVVAIDSKNKTVSIELRVVPSTLGENTSIPSIINLRGAPSDPTPLDNFSFHIKDTNFNNFNWQLTANSGTKTLIFDLKKGTDISVGYRDTTHSPNAEIWDKNSAFTVVGNYVDIDLLSNTTLLTYIGVNVGTNTPCANKIIPSDLSTPHDFTWGGIITPGSTQSLYNVTQHYIWLMSQLNGDLSLSGCSPAGKHSPQPSSTMLLNYSATGAITYLHITDNKADVGIS